MTISHDIARPALAEPEERNTMHDRRSTAVTPRRRRTRELSPITSARPLARPLHATIEDRVEVAVLGALGRLARRLGTAALSIAR